MLKCFQRCAIKKPFPPSLTYFAKVSNFPRIGSLLHKFAEHKVSSSSHLISLGGDVNFTDNESIYPVSVARECKSKPDRGKKRNFNKVSPPEENSAIYFYSLMKLQYSKPIQ